MLATSEKANQALTKRHNARLVLKSIYDREPISRADIARITNLTATTVSHVIGELLLAGVAEEVGSISTDRGKPPMLVGLCKNARHVIALNLAQNIFRGGVLNLRGEVLHQQSVPAEGLQGDQALATVHAMVDALLPKVNQPLLGIGVGAPGIIDVEHGVINRAVNLCWYDLPLAQILARRYDLPIYIVNDNQASLLAEQIFGQHKNTPDLVVIRVGRGIGAGLMVDGQLVRRFGAGEIGHITVVENGERCSCGNFGCLETIASSRAIVQRTRQLLPHHPTSWLSRRAALQGEVDIQSVVAALAAGDDFLIPIVTEAGRALGGVIAHLVSILGTPHILLCGSVTGFGRTLLQPIEAEVQRRSLTGQLRRPQIDFVSLESDIIMLGATALLLRNELGLF
jgi:N-acetylglucosamine repressor